MITISSFQNAQFIHCVKPNSEGISNSFDQDFVSVQLKTVGAGPLLDLMRHGHTARLGYDTIISKFGQYSRYKPKPSLDFCRQVLRAIGFDFNALVMGRTQIFFRSKSETFVNKLLALSEDEVKRVAKVASEQMLNQKRRILRIRIIYLGKRKLFSVKVPAL